MDENMQLVTVLAGAFILIFLMRIFGILFLYRLIRWAIRDTLSIRDDQGLKRKSGAGWWIFWILIILAGAVIAFHR